jgi:hypothetical protein
MIQLLEHLFKRKKSKRTLSAEAADVTLRTVDIELYPLSSSVEIDWEIIPRNTSEVEMLRIHDVFLQRKKELVRNILETEGGVGKKRPFIKRGNRKNNHLY